MTHHLHKKILWWALIRFTCSSLHLLAFRAMTRVPPFRCVLARWSMVWSSCCPDASVPPFLFCTIQQSVVLHYLISDCLLFLSLDVQLTVVQHYLVSDCLRFLSRHPADGGSVRHCYWLPPLSLFSHPVDCGSALPHFWLPSLSLFNHPVDCGSALPHFWLPSLSLFRHPVDWFCTTLFLTASSFSL